MAKDARRSLGSGIMPNPRPSVDKSAAKYVKAGERQRAAMNTAAVKRAEGKKPRNT